MSSYISPNTIEHWHDHSYFSLMIALKENEGICFPFDMSSRWLNKSLQNWREKNVFFYNNYLRLLRMIVQLLLAYFIQAASAETLDPAVVTSSLLLFCDLCSIWKIEFSSSSLLELTCVHFDARTIIWARLSFLIISQTLCTHLYTLFTF